MQVLICLDAIREMRTNIFSLIEGVYGPIRAELDWIEELRIQLAIPELESVLELMDY